MTEQPQGHPLASNAVLSAEDGQRVGGDRPSLYWLPCPVREHLLDVLCLGGDDQHVIQSQIHLGGPADRPQSTRRAENRWPTADAMS